MNRTLALIVLALIVLVLLTTVVLLNIEDVTAAQFIADLASLFD